MSNEANLITAESIRRPDVEYFAGAPYYYGGEELFVAALRGGNYMWLLEQRK